MGKVLLFCNSCGVIIKRIDTREISYEETCPFCGIHSKVAWRRKPFKSMVKGKNMVIPELQRWIVATSVNSRLGFLLKLRFEEATAVVA